MLCLLENGALQRVAHQCIHVSVDGYLWSRFNNAELLSITCRTTNINVAMVDSSPPKFFLNLWGILCILENSALQRVVYLCIYVSGDGYLWSGFNSAELLSITCKTVNINVVMVDSSPPIFCLHFWGILCIIENNALQKVAYLCIHVSMNDMTE